MRWKAVGAKIIGAGLVAASVAPGAWAREGKPKPPALPVGTRVAIYSHDGSGGNGVDRVVGDMLATALRKAGVRIIERQDLQAITREQELVRSGIVDPRTAVPGGKVLGVDYVIDVKATEFGIKNDRFGAALGLGPLAALQLRKNTARVVLDARLLDARTGAVVVADTASGSQPNLGATLLGGSIARGRIALGGIDINSSEWSESSLGKASRKAVTSLVKRFAGDLNPGQGSVLALLPGGGAVVSLGSFDNVHEGQVLDVMRQETVKDSQGNVVWTEDHPVGQVRLTEVRGDRSRVVPVQGDQPLQEGDLVLVRR